MTHTTDYGRAFCIARLTEAAQSGGRVKLDARWDCIGDHYKKDPAVLTHKYKLERGLT